MQDIEFVHFGFGYADSGFVSSRVELRLHDEAFGRADASDELDDRLVGRSAGDLASSR